MIDLINNVLNLSPDRLIREVELLNPFNPKESLDDKLSILDIKARDQTGRQINVEMQMVPNVYFKNRIVYCLAKLHQQQLQEGDDYSVLKPTISIIFLNQVHHPETSDYHLRFRLLEEQHHFPYNGDPEVLVLELPKFMKAEAELSTGLEKWLYFLQLVEKMDPEALPRTLWSPLFARAMKELVMLSQTNIERERYEARRKAQLDYNSGLKGARLEGRQKVKPKDWPRVRLGRSSSASDYCSGPSLR